VQTRPLGTSALLTPHRHRLHVHLSASVYEGLILSTGILLALVIVLVIVATGPAGALAVIPAVSLFTRLFRK